MDAAELVESSRPPESLRAGSTLGRYLLLCPIARGGMGQVWAARQTGPLGLPQVVAVKIAIPFETTNHEQIQQHLFDEAQVAASIDHPNVCKILELGAEGGALFITMELLHGASLSALLAASPGRKLDYRVAAHLVAQACSGLHAAHELTDEDGETLEVVHRDATPHNLFVTSAGELKVMDFGIVKSKNQLHQATQTGELKGKLSYLAPEQIRGKGIDRRADIFALGGVLFIATLGRNPFMAPGEDAGTALLRITQGEYPTPAYLDPDYPPELEAIVHRALALNPDDRFQTADEMRVALQGYLDSSSRPVTREEVTAILKKHCGAAIDQRKAEIRNAQRTFDSRGYSPASGTFPATDASYSESPTLARVEQTLESSSGPGSASFVQLQNPFRSASRRKTGVLLVALAAASSLLTLTLVRWASTPASVDALGKSESRGSATNSAPMIAPPSPTPAPDPSGRVAAQASAEGPAARASAPESTTTPKGRSSKKVGTGSSRAAVNRGAEGALEAAAARPAAPPGSAPFSETVTRKPSRHAIDESDPFAK
jgi:serine/threonine protein kinase